MKNKKINKKFEKLFNKYEDDEMKAILSEELIKNIKYYKSCMEAKEILNQSNLPFFGMTKYHYYILNQLTLLCEKYNVFVDKNIDISFSDVIERIKENYNIQYKLYEDYKDIISKEIHAIQKDNNYIYLLNTNELTNLYHNIIEKLKDDDKVMVKKYE